MSFLLKYFQSNDIKYDHFKKYLTFYITFSKAFELYIS